MMLTMERTGTCIFIAWLLHIVCITSGLDVKTEVGQIQYGENVTLKCILQSPNTATQVTWSKVVGDMETFVANYSSDSRAEISEGYKDRLWISTTNLNETEITISKIRIMDEGCYKCTFNSLTKGTKEGEVCLTIPGEVLIEKNHKVGLFKPVTLKCMRKVTKDGASVLTISWMKNGKNIATYSEEAYIAPEYQGLINVTKEGGDVSALTLFRANVTDGGKYSCVFNVFPGGSKTGETSLHIYEPLNVTVSTSKASGSHTITCVAKSWPPPVVSWVDVDEGSLNHTAYDGLITVTSTIQICPDSQQKKRPKCKVLHQGEESLFSVSAGRRCRLHPVIIVLLLSKMFFL
ncbi:nectin-3-like [Hyla sarda]|uniref:nectin-3-like n=1 Tax=Hyla sarda TaxID=327740 RepID=UPI0024C3B6C5|nr:nectin-3-like [Hyla sarda]